MPADSIGILAVLGWGIVGTGIGRSMNMNTVARTGVGVYVITLNNPVTVQSDGCVLASISGPYKADATFADSTHITITVYSLATAVIADPPNGTVIKLAGWQ